ncbi:SusD/RagB family nutrient-binding outer membrane lipoprotein [Barnesiella intestinihominis]|uniref:SusD/RagB family nutrient-binding outer membrane lipoprotein n=1 Tax=Barnesiella intestinihominis TaxID=487174 RepID=UPI001898818B|nr:SusD/RagB family nutrient-binding outer membrane lipoprotein [Barnesiella intestinihominis]MDB0664532.1 SusD/RagB family nutrient-binding outer membrane lipoprotein [Barnesiella intestinihominis]MDB0667047.1 SusD/RagB family nutrient-binding outer membrane lipoprotein [Barnesiella intestinihominis]
MNKYKVIILSLLISFMGASCEDWLYDNVNEDAAHEVLPQQVLPVVLFYSAQLQFDHAEYGAYLTQTLTTGGRNQTSSFAYKSGWGDFLTMNRHPQWRRHFYDIGVNAKEIIDEAHEAQAWNLELIGRTLRLMSTQMTTDLFGDMPRSEAYESNSPHYDTQESIYEWMNQEIEELIGMYEDSTYTEAATNIPIDQSIDRVFAGDLNKWKHYTYALKARLLLRKLPNWENNAATCQAIITAVNRALEGWEDVLYRFDGGNGAQNSPWGEAFGSTEQGGLGWEGRGNMLNSAVPTKYFMENILGVFESHNNLKGWAEDPRILAFMSARPGPSGTSDSGTEMRYLDTNIGMDVSYKVDNYPTLFPEVDGKKVSVYTQNTGYVPLFLEEELLLIKAEATYWSGDKPTARSLTMQAAEINFDRFNLSSIYGSSYTRYRNNYLGNETGTGNYVTTYFPADGFNIGHIMRQKYVCLYLQPEQWTDMRRYNYSCEENGIQYDNTYVYPGLKRPNNIYEAHWGDDPKAWINRINYDPETEEKYNKAELERLGAYKNYQWLRKPMIWQ